MKKYKKAQVVAKNNPRGSYAAGCPQGSRGGGTGPSVCKKCELVQ